MTFFRVATNPTCIDSEMSHVVAVVAKYFGLSQDEIISRIMERYVVVPRQIAMYFMKQIKGATCQRIGEYMSGYHHATVLNHIGVVNDLIDTDPEYKSDVQKIAELLNSRGTKFSKS
jgi:chromosomal replication initiator protein